MAGELPIFPNMGCAVVFITVGTFGTGVFVNV